MGRGGAGRGEPAEMAKGGGDVEAGEGAEETRLRVLGRERGREIERGRVKP